MSRREFAHHEACCLTSEQDAAQAEPVGAPLKQFLGFHIGRSFPGDATVLVSANYEPTILTGTLLCCRSSSRYSSCWEATHSFCSPDSRSR